MKKIWLLCATLISLHDARAADAPFAPLSDVPDYVATLSVKLAHGPVVQERRSYHNGWTRVDGNFYQNSYHSTVYFGPGPVFFVPGNKPSAKVEGFDQLSIFRGDAMAHLVRAGERPFKTGESQSLLGESCDVWNLSPKRVIRLDGKHLSCVTPDGIELWFRIDDSVISRSTFETTALERRLVKADEVRPPLDRLDLRSWLTNDTPPSADTPGDATIVMQSRPPAAGRSHTRTVKRHYPWIYIEDVDDKGWRRLQFKNELERLDISFETDASGPISLHIQKAPGNVKYPSLPESGRTETVLGELCSVFQQKMREAYSCQCRTVDGLVLKTTNQNNFEDYSLVAVKLDRGPVGLDGAATAEYI